MNSFVEMSKFLLQNRTLSERFSQYPPENYFGRQRVRGGGKPKFIRPFFNLHIQLHISQTPNNLIFQIVLLRDLATG